MPFTLRETSFAFMTISQRHFEEGFRGKTKKAVQ